MSLRSKLCPAGTIRVAFAWLPLWTTTPLADTKGTGPRIEVRAQTDLAKHEIRAYLNPVFIQSVGVVEEARSPAKVKPAGERRGDIEAYAFRAQLHVHCRC